MKKFVRWYVKYLLHSSMIFYMFLLTFIGMFLLASFTLQLDCHQTYPAEKADDTIIVSDAIRVEGNIVYYYVNRDETVYQAQLLDYEVKDSSTYIHINDDNAINGVMTVDVVVGQQSLLERIFIQAGKGQ